MLDRTLVPPERIRQFALFRDLDDDLIAEVQGHAKLVGLGPNEPLFSQFDPMHRSYYCLEGRVKLFRLSHDGGEKIFHIACSGDSLWDSLSLSSERRFPLSCSAIVTSELMAVEIDLMRDLFNRSHAFRIALAGALMNRLGGLLDHVEVLSADKASFRVASYLLAESRHHQDRVAFRLKASKKHIASYLSLQPETLSRCLTSFRRQGLAESRGREIRILDPDRLHELVASGSIAAPDA